MDGRDICIFFTQEIQQNLLSDKPKVSCKDGIVILGRTVKIGQVLPDGITCSRCHAASHVKRVTKTKINDFACSDSGDRGISLLASKRCISGCFLRLWRFGA